MCQLFINADSQWWSSRTKSLRIDGVVTSVRLEEFFWRILEEIALRDTMTVNQLITKLYLESIDAEHDVGSFASFLRVCCSRYLSLAADGLLDRQQLDPLAEMESGSLISAETNAMQKRQDQYAKQYVGDTRIN